MGLTRTFVNYEDHYTQLPNRWLRDERLSRRARGLLAEVMSHRVGWRVSVTGLQKAGPEGRDAIRSTIDELLRHGYLIRRQTQGDSGRFNEVEYEVCDPFAADGKPVTGGSAADGSTADGSADVGESDTKEDQFLEDQSLEDQVKNSAPDGAVALLDVPGESRPNLDDQFEQLWQLWPRSESKQAARKALVKALKLVSFPVLLGSVEAWAYGAVQKWPEDKIPYFASWLNGQRWTEEPPKPDTSRAPGQQLRGGELLSDLAGLGAMMDQQTTKGIAR